METGLALRPAEEGETLADPKAYQSLLGSLLWLASYTRPDVSHAVSVLGQFASKPTVLHKRALVRIGRYVLTTCTQGLRYRPCARHSLEFFSDASYGDRAQGRSSIGFIVTRSGAAVSGRQKGSRKLRAQPLRLSCMLSTLPPAKPPISSSSCRRLTQLRTRQRLHSRSGVTTRRQTA